MNLETYEKLTAELGIGRGALAPGGRFMEDCPSVVPHQEKVQHIRKVSRKIVPPPLKEDLSRFEKGKFDWRLGQGSGGPRHFVEHTRAFYELLYDRTSPAELARALGCHRSAVHNAIRGSRMGRAVRERLLPLLTPEERAALPPMDGGKA